MYQTLAYYVSALRKDFSEYCERHLQEMEVSQGLLFFLIYIGRHPNCTPKEMAAVLHMDMAHTSRSLCKLEQNDFLSQSLNPKDKRSHLLCLTEKGERTFLEIHTLFLKWDETVMASFTTEERQMFLSLFAKLHLTKETEEC